MWVRDVTSGAFSPRYTPNYRIVAIHGPNRIVVRDEKGVETVRRASHLKVCNLKEKVAAMIPEQDEYCKFGRSTKLLLHPKDVLDFQFTSKSEEKGEILPNNEVSVMELSIDSNAQGTVNTSHLRVWCGKILPKVEKPERTQSNNSNEQYIVGCIENLKNDSEISPDAADKGEIDKICENHTWFQNSADCISRWSKALKLGLGKSVGLDLCNTAQEDSKGGDSLGFLFFL